MITETYITLKDELAIAEKEIDAINESIKALNKCMVGNMQDIQGIDYSKDRVQEGTKIGFIDYLERIGKLARQGDNLEKYVDEIKIKMCEIEKMLAESRGRHHQVIYCRYGLRLTQEQTAERTGYSVSQVHRIEEKYKKVVDKVYNNRVSSTIH